MWYPGIVSFLTAVWLIGQFAATDATRQTGVKGPGQANQQIVMNAAEWIR